jgi:hypothetical protein
MDELDRDRAHELTEVFARVTNFEIDHLLHHLRRRKSDVKREELNTNERSDQYETSLDLLR